MRLLYVAFAILPFAILGCQSGTESSSGTDSSTPAPTQPSTGSTGSAGATASTDAEVTFAAIQPILSNNCVGCHGESDPKEGVDLTSFESVMKGGEHGPIVAAGDPENSLLVQC